ncbi:hypothetical protein H2198_000045 [Neophaeococcomyces mojaviensis]|uniref:Uncharacterized protein n=1 Tax=Neophaeococcomyces mojaviensis TaxID=3383035 RepID=A0ACC3AL95_9EURO|nr:hypothetical protein H2198_000045 [Knufia sp. JES_112]
MPLAHRLSSSLSSFRFSLTSHPINKSAGLEPGSLSICHSSNDSTPRANSPDDASHDEEKHPKITVVDSDDTALPTTTLSPITPWHASYHRHAASTTQETAYLNHTYRLRIARLILSFLLLSFAATITGLYADIVRHYHATHLPSAFHLNLWPTDLNLTPTLLTLATASIVTILSLIYILITALPAPVPRTKLSNGLFVGLTTLSLPLTIAALATSAALSPAAIFSTFINSAFTIATTKTGPSNTSGLSPAPHGAHAKSETIQSFTCQIVNTARAFNSDATTLQLPATSATSDLTPSGFTKLCTESRVGNGLIIALLVFEIMALGVVVVGLVVEKKIRNLRVQREVSSREGESMPESMVGDKVSV